MTELWRDRLVESIQHAFDACWNPPPQPFRSASFEFPSEDEERLEADLRLLARADFVLPFAAAGLLDEREPVGNLSAPADIRREVHERQLADRSTSVGCQIAITQAIDNPAFREELVQEWSVWLTFCMHAHSLELRRTFPFLLEARDAIGETLIAPKRRLERIGSDGELLASLVPRRTEDAFAAARVDTLLDQCEIVAAHADSFRILGPLFPQLIATVSREQSRSSSDHESAFPFVAELWPFGTESFFAIAEICDGIQRLASTLNVDDDGEGRKTRDIADLRQEDELA